MAGLVMGYGSNLAYVLRMGVSDFVMWFKRKHAGAIVTNSRCRIVHYDTLADEGLGS